MISNAELESLLEENECLREEVRQLRSRPLQGGNNRNVLCLGCYRLRLVLGAFIGISGAVGCWSILGDERAFAAFQSFLGMAGNSGAAKLWKVGAVATVAVLPMIAIAFNWKWRLYKNGCPGLLRGVAECRRAFREGRGRK